MLPLQTLLLEDSEFISLTPLCKLPCSRKRDSLDLFCNVVYSVCFVAAGSGNMPYCDEFCANTGCTLDLIFWFISFLLC